ncbi:MAG: hypothetical protein K2O97_00120 [Acetatifactor sp.]|nr:hypothetical protein [Acetatifactor sp.]
MVQNPDGTAGIVRRQLEPLAADIRGRTKRDMLKALKTEKLRLLAPMFSLNYDDLRQRHRERRMKRILAVSSTAAAVCLCFGAFSTYMALRIQRQKEQIEEQAAVLEAQALSLKVQAAEIEARNEALLENQARNLAAEALRLLEQGDRIQAIETAACALTEYEGMALPYTPEAQYALTESLLQTELASDDGSRNKEKLVFWNLSTGELWEAPADTYRVADVEVGNGLAYVPDNCVEENYDSLHTRLTAWDLMTREILWRSSYESRRDGKQYAIPIYSLEELLAKALSDVL